MLHFCTQALIYILIIYPYIFKYGILIINTVRF